MVHLKLAFVPAGQPVTAALTIVMTPGEARMAVEALQGLLDYVAESGQATDRVLDMVPCTRTE